MKRFWDKNKSRIATQVIGVLIGVAAIYFSFKNINSSDLKHSLSSVKVEWLIPIILANFVVIALKAYRWQILLALVKKIRFFLVYRVLIIGYMANNILPARLGEAVRIQMLGKDADVSKVTTTASLVADRIIEGLSFLMLAVALVLLTNVPKWMNYGLTITLLITVIAYTVAIIYSTRDVEHHFLKKIQDGVKPLLNWGIFSRGFVSATISWLIQVLMIHMTQLAFGVYIPIWSSLLVLIAVNLAIVVPSAPAQLGTFELACVLAYTSLGLDKELALLIGATYHFMQIIPITLAGGVFMLTSQLRDVLPDRATDDLEKSDIAG